MCCGGLAGYPFYAMVAMGLLTHGLIMAILVNGWKFRSSDARAALVLSRQSFPDSRKTADGRPDYQEPRPRPRVTRYGTT